jgi:hypothetical protein
VVGYFSVNLENLVGFWCEKVSWAFLNGTHCILTRTLLRASRPVAVLRGSWVHCVERRGADAGVCDTVSSGSGLNARVWW